MKTYPLAEAKAKLSGLIDEVSRRDERVTITKHGRPAAVLMSPNEVESIEATLEIMSDPEFYAEILRNSAALEGSSSVVRRSSTWNVRRRAADVDALEVLSAAVYRVLTALQIAHQLGASVR
ncbi:MAG: type II toxin-antitoxin system Phd/YefM family antitoxin [Chloroflexi bacterium]|nr:MAG: type II toxin-antitoxin system Phd/YefM family antitoxin [Chloroflexota bacterium]